MLVIPIPDPGLGNTSYLVDLGDGSALVVDPERDPRPYLEVANRLGLAIRHIAETHLHADFVSGARELIDLGASLIAPRESHLAFPHRGVEGGDELAVGDLRLQAVATPGHTPEHLAYLLFDGSAPQVVFTGGTLMAGGVARPDLVSPNLTLRLAREAYRSVRRLLETLPGEVEVRPTHGGGSFCSAGASSGGGVTTIATERHSHPAALTPDEDAFVAELLTELGTYPTYFQRLRPVNRRGPKVFGVDLPALAPLAADDLRNSVVVDVRPIERFAARHIPGSISIELRGQFGTWLGWLFEPTEPVVFVLDPDQDERELVRQALNVGHEAIAGKITLEDWAAAGGDPASIGLRSPGEVLPGAPLLDVRQRSEWESEHASGATHVELGELAANPIRVAAGTVVHCGHGQRAMTAASLLARQGVDGIEVTAASASQIIAALSAA